MLKKLYLQNFKCYRQADIDCKPITVFCGENSSGKTAILKSLLMLKQSFESTQDNYLLLNGPYTENGSFSELLHKFLVPSDDGGMNVQIYGEDIRFKLSFSVPDGPSEIRKSLKNTALAKFYDGEITAEFLFCKNDNVTQIANAQETVIRFSYAFDIGPYAYPQRFPVPFEEVRRELSIRLKRRGSGGHYDLYLEGFPQYLSKKRPQNKSGEDELEAIMQWNFQRSQEAHNFYIGEAKNCVCYFNGMQLVSLYKDELSTKVTKALPIIYALYRFLAVELGKIHDLGPLRKEPKRQYLNAGMYTGVGFRGENAARFLALWGKRKYRDIPLPDEISSAQPVALSEAVARWTEALDIGEVRAVRHDIPGAAITQVMVNRSNWMDVGFGVSQALPILVEGLSMPKGNSLILEQPEIHLHPRMQMDITDFLIALYKSGRYLILETHSDHVINRLVHRALEDEKLRKDIRIFYVERDARGESNLYDVPIYEDGFRVVPKGFFDQFASETQFIFNAAQDNLRREWEKR